jgi:hypothetical protein
MKKITKDEFLKVQKQDHFISGIHNYCDKWCERCPKTAFCSVFAMDAAFRDEDFENHLNNSLSYMGNMFEIVAEMIQETMEKHNIVISDEDLEESKIEIEKERNFTDNHDLTKIAHQYFKETDSILNRNQEFFQSQIDKTIAVFADEKQTELLSLKDSFEIIRWYCTMIPAKISRGVGNVFDNNELIEDWEKNERYGTFKVALISIKRSMIAWAKVLETFPEKEDEILVVLILLEKMFKSVNEICPEAETHKRVGFEI